MPESELKRVCASASFMDITNGVVIMCEKKCGGKAYQDYKELKGTNPEDICVGSARCFANHPLEYFYARWEKMEACKNRTR